MLSRSCASIVVSLRGSAVLDLVEAVVLADAVGRTFTGTVIDADDKDPTRGTALLDDPAVEAPVAADVPLPLGEPVRLTLERADVDDRSVRFRWDGP